MSCEAEASRMKRRSTFALIAASALSILSATVWPLSAWRALYTVAKPPAPSWSWMTHWSTRSPGESSSDTSTSLNYFRRSARPNRQLQDAGARRAGGGVEQRGGDVGGVDVARGIEVGHVAPVGRRVDRAHGVDDADAHALV